MLPLTTLELTPIVRRLAGRYRYRSEPDVRGVNIQNGAVLIFSLRVLANC